MVLGKDSNQTSLKRNMNMCHCIITLSTFLTAKVFFFFFNYFFFPTSSRRAGKVSHLQLEGHSHESRCKQTPPSTAGTAACPSPAASSLETSSLRQSQHQLANEELHTVLITVGRAKQRQS